jgi:hypothetical protein
MKTALKLSALLNLGLLACLAFVWSMPEKHEAPVARPIVVQSTTPPPAAAAPIISKQVQPAPFRWTQLESADYRTYVKNLQGIGCPAATLRAIVTADIDGVYAAKHDELEQQLTAMQNAGWSERLNTYSNQQDLATEMQKLPGEERAEIDDLLGLKPQPVAVVAAGQNQPPRQQPTSLPMVMQNIDLSQLNFDDQQKQAFNDVRQQFLEDIGGPNQNPNDPTYLARWQKAQSTADTMLESTLGNDAFTKVQMLEYQKSLESQAP